MFHHLNAEYLDGQSALRRPCRVTFDPHRLLIVAEGKEGEVQWPTKKVRVDVIRSDLLYLYVDPQSGERLEFKDSDDIAWILKSFKVKSFDLEHNTLSRIVLGLILLVGLGLTFWRMTPQLSRWIAQKIPLEVEAQIRPRVLESISPEICKDPNAQASLEKIHNRLLDHSSPRPDIKIFLMKSQEVNAFALAGGVILVNRGLIEKVSGQEALAGIIAHEIHHHLERHILSQIVRATFVSMLWNLAIGDFSSFAVLDPATLSQLMTLKYGRDDELEADRRAAEMLTSAGLSAKPLAGFLDELSTQTEFLPEFLSTHPLDGRGKILIELSRQEPTQNSALPLNPDEWTVLKQASCP